MTMSQTPAAPAAYQPTPITLTSIDVPFTRLVTFFFKAALAAIPDSVVDELIVHGPAEACREHIARYVENGVTAPALATAQVDTLRIKLLKLAAVVTRNTRRIRLYMASNWPSAQVFAHAMSQLRSP